MFNLNRLLTPLFSQIKTWPSKTGVRQISQNMQDKYGKYEQKDFDELHKRFDREKEYEVSLQLLRC